MIEGALSGRVLQTLPLTLLVGVVYALVVHRIESTGRTEGYTWLEVVIGVGITLGLSVLVVGPDVVAALFWMFAATGVPMIGFTIYRYEKARKWARRALIDDYAAETTATSGSRSRRGSRPAAAGSDEGSGASAE